MALLILPAFTTATETVSSPDGRIVVNCNIVENPKPYARDERFYYNVSFQGVFVIRDSPLGIELRDTPPLDNNFRLYGIDRKTGNETYSLVHGSRKKVRNHYNQMTFFLQEKHPPFRLLQIVFRVYNDGVAFRYVLPRQENLADFAITQERSGFYFPYDYTAYSLSLETFSTPYEANYTIASVGSLPSQSIIGLPFLLDTEQKAWIAITEAALTDYAGMYLTPTANVPNALTSSLSPRHDDPAVKVVGSTPFQTPWRVILIGDNPGDLIASNLVLDLNDPCAIADPSWIKPGKCVCPGWSDWWVQDVDFQCGLNTSTLLHYLDFAAQHGIEYLLIDAGWYGVPNNRYENITTSIAQIDLQTIIAEGKNKGVGVLLWVFWESVVNQMDRAFPLYERWGVAGIVVDRMHRDDQEMVNICHRIFKKAAQHHLLVDFHGVYKPTGLLRTYPNLITQEAVLGLEYCKRSRQCNPEHELILPFTRMLAGPMDFTPGCFRTVTEKKFDPQSKPPVAMGTRCHQLAMYVIYASPLQMCVDYPSAYRNQPGIAFLEAVPTTWDSTIVLDGKVGDHITVARRHGTAWYIGSMTDWTPRELLIPLGFLGEGTFTAEIYHDSPDVAINPTRVKTREVTVTASDTLRAPMGPGGGYAVKIYPVTNEAEE